MSTDAIDALDVATYTIPTDAPEADGTMAWDSTTMIVVRVRAQGRTGTGWTYGSPACAAAVTEHLRDVVVDADPLDVPAIFATMVKSVRNAARVGAIGYALSAVDTALWDLKARILQVPLYRLFGAARPDVPIYGSGGFTSYDEAQLEHQLTSWADQGIDKFKIKIGESWGTNTDRDLTRIRQARGIIGDRAELYVDANGGYRRKQAIRVMERAADARVLWYEEPVSSDDVEGLREVRAAVRPDVAAGEYGTDLVYFQRLCGAGAVDCLQADVTRCGGYSEWLRIASVAAAHGLELSGHCAPNLHAHVAMTTPNFRHLEWFHDHTRIETIFFDNTLTPHDGVICPDPDQPGNGLVLKSADAEHYRTG